MADCKGPELFQSTPDVVGDGLKELHLQKEDTGQRRGEALSKNIVRRERPLGGDMSPSTVSRPHSLQSPRKQGASSQSSTVSTPKNEEVIPSSVTLKQQPGQPPKLARSTSQKVISRTPPTFDDYQSRTDEAKGTFQVIPGCTYSSKAIGATDHAMDCECAEEWDASVQANAACGDDSDCINRATKMECVGDCGCGAECQNQRFQRQQYAQVTVIKTEKKGYGLRADTALRENDFVYEYIGEVIGEGHFRRRMQQYDEEKIKHFYFMSLNKGEFVDATKKGNLGRFCNHSCNPNCYVDKWVVGDKLRMGIFAERPIKAGEELVFNYNVDRYGADPQPCYCGESNCTGFIGGKTQTESGTKLSQATVEALGIDDGDSWDTAVARKPRKKKVNEEDEEWVNKVEPKGLDEDGVTKVMATLMQCKEKWITVKLLSRIQRSNDERVRNRVVKMHGYQILNSVLASFKDDCNIVLQILDILSYFPRLTRNKISDSKIEGTIETLKDGGDERVEAQATALLNEWSTLETAYRIPRKKRDLNEIPGGPRAMPAHRPAPFYSGPRPTYRPPRQHDNRLPEGWYPATTEDGRTYYYNARGATTWTRPTLPAIPPPPPQKAASNNKALEDIISEITSAKAHALREKSSASGTPQPAASEARKDSKASKEKWRSYPEDKQKKVYENTLFPPVKSVVDTYKHKLPKDDLKRFAKQVAKKLVDSDYKHHRVEDPTKISPSQERHVKKHVKEFFDKAVLRKKQRDAEDAEKMKSNTAKGEINGKPDEGSDGDENMELSDVEPEQVALGTDIPTVAATPVTPADQSINGDRLKRKRSEDQESNGRGLDDVESTPSKRLRSETPPPPPPPPDETPLGASNLLVSASIEEAAKQTQTLADVDMAPHVPAPEGPEYTEDDTINGFNGAGTRSMFLNGVDRASSDGEGDEAEMDKRNRSMHGLGIGQMPEVVVVHQGH
ncbi:MAG: hypothetical protein Q9197_000216 [Variospora fuerteventurae]